tara:strand:+ start:1531 stop:2523 length:993 start_codon:yes stop_codon:yes gene_type:complete
MFKHINKYINNPNTYKYINYILSSSTMYSLSFFNELLFKNTSYVLPNAALTGIHDLHLFMDIGKETEQSVYKNVKRNKNEVDNWKKKEKFKATSMVKKEGIEQLFGDLKTNLNKLSSINYEIQYTKILELIETIIAIDNDTESTSNEYIKQITNVLLTVACNNKYHSNLYSKLYINLMDNYLYMSQAKDNLINKYLLEVHDIEIIDPNIDYDKFCEMNKKNEYRRAGMLFIINLYKGDAYELDKVIEIIQKIINFIKINMNNAEYIDIINEISEIVNVFVLNMNIEIKEKPELKFVLDNVILFSKYKTKDYPGISSRTMFKYMDMLDKFK